MKAECVVPPPQEINTLKTELEAAKFDVIKYCVGELERWFPPKKVMFILPDRPKLVQSLLGCILIVNCDLPKFQFFARYNTDESFV